MSKMLNDRLNPVWHTMLCSCCTHMAAVGIRGLRILTQMLTSDIVTSQQLMNNISLQSRP